MRLFIGAETMLVPQEQGRPVGGGWIEWKRKKFLTDSYWTSPDIRAAITDLGMDVIVFVPDAIVGVCVEREFDFRWEQAETIEDRAEVCRRIQPLGSFVWLDKFDSTEWTRDEDDVLLIDVAGHIRRLHLKNVRDWLLKG